MKWCVIGAGGIADRRTIPAIVSDKENELLAVMDRNPVTAETVGKKYGVPFYSDEKEMLKNHPCDAVYIGTPVSVHYEQAMNALSFGANVFTEKPIAMNAKEGEALAAAFRRAGKLLFVGYMMKYHNLHEKAKRLVEQGKIGQVTDVRLQFSCWYPDIQGAWRQKKALGGGGAIMDLGVHCIELAEFVLGERIADVTGFYGTRSFKYEVEDSGVFAFRTESGILGHIDVNFNIPDDASESKLEVYGTKGYVICRGTLGQEEKGSLSYLYSPQGDYVAQQSRTIGKPKKYYGGNANLYLKQIRHFTKLVKDGCTDSSFAESAAHVQEIVDELYAEKR